MVRYSLLLMFCMLAGALRAQSGLAEHINRDTLRGASPEWLLKEARKAARDEKDYYRAIRLYELLLQVEPENRPAWVELAAVSVKRGAYKPADRAYTNLTLHNWIRLNPDELLQVADIKYRVGKYDEAIFYFDSTTRRADATPEIKNRAAQGRSLALWALDVRTDSSEIAWMPLDSLNTSYSELAPQLFENTLYYSSYSFPFKKDLKRPKRDLIQVMQTATDALDERAAQPASFNKEDKHTAHTAFNAAGTEMYYAECEYIGDVEMECALYRRRRQYNGWGPAEKLPPSINQKGSSNTEPSVGRVPNVPGDVLFFVSDRPDRGKKHIWYSRIYRDSFGAALPLTAVNSDSNDVTPYYHYATNTLYFSTDGRKTLGGFDVYKTVLTEKGWSEPENLGIPINSGANDVFYSLSKGGKQQFWSSNRNGLDNDSEVACCYDLFASAQPVLIAVTWHERTRDSLRGTNIRLQELDPSGAVRKEQSLDVAGAFQFFSIKPRHSYRLIASKERFVSDTVEFNTLRLWSDTIVQHLYLNQGRVKLLVTVCDRETGAPMPHAKVTVNLAGNSVPLIAYDSIPEQSEYRYNLDFDQNYTVEAAKPGYSSDATPVPTFGLDYTKDHELLAPLCVGRAIYFSARIVDALTEEPIEGATIRFVDLTRKHTKTAIDPESNMYYDTLAYNREYFIHASKANYIPDSLEFNTDERLLPKMAVQRIDTILKLYKLLPFTLYFDNDQPEPRTYDTTTQKQYFDTYLTYYRRREEFKANYSKGLTGKAKETAEKEIADFFDLEVKGGWEKLFRFSEQLYPLLRAGDTISLILRGHASPLAKPAYNTNLTKRRVNCVHNHFRYFDEFVTNSLYGTFYNNQLFIKELPLGEDEPLSKNVSDDKSKPRQSIYSPAASRERRLEVVGAIIRRRGGSTDKTNNLEPNPTP